MIKIHKAAKSIRNTGGQIEEKLERTDGAAKISLVS